MLLHLASQRGLRGGVTDPASNPSGPPTKNRVTSGTLDHSRIDLNAINWDGWRPDFAASLRSPR